MGVHASCSSPALAPGESGETFISHLPLPPQVARHQRTSLGVCSVTKTLDSEPREDLGLKEQETRARPL